MLLDDAWLVKMSRLSLLLARFRNNESGTNLVRIEFSDEWFDEGVIHFNGNTFKAKTYFYTLDQAISGATDAIQIEYGEPVV